MPVTVYLRKRLVDENNVFNLLTAKLTKIKGSNSQK